MATYRMKLLFVIASFVEGGAQRVMANIITKLDNKKYEISLILFEKKGPYLSQIPDYVKVYDLDYKSRYSFFKLILRLSRLLRKIRPNTVMSFLSYTNIVVLLAKILSVCKFNLIISVRNYLSYDTSYQRLSRIKYFLYKLLFNYADTIVVPSVGVKKNLEYEFNIIKRKIRVIYNPIDIKKIKELKEEELEDIKIKERFFLLTIGRLTKQKDLPCLLKAYSKIHNKINEKLLILGTGEDEEKLKLLSRELGIQENVYFLGFHKNPYKFMNNSSIFILPSLWEGFPNVLIEAMACGVPVISTNCPSGPSEIIINGKNGILVPPSDEKALAEAMLILLRDRSLRKRYSIEGIKRAEDFRIDKILTLYEGLF